MNLMKPQEKNKIFLARSVAQRLLRCPMKLILSRLRREPCQNGFISFGKFYFFLGSLFVFFFLLFIPVTQAQVIGSWEFLNGIVPCGTSYATAPCTVCHFYKLLQNIINFLLFTSTALVTLMAIYVAFLFLFSGGSPKTIEDAKSKLWLLLWGIAWVLGSWLVLNTIITFFADPSVFPTPWNQISC